MAHRRIDEADAAAAKGRTRTARECYLPAAVLLGIAYHPLFGTPVDPRLLDAFRLQMQVFDRGTALGPSPGEAVDVPYENTTLPAWFLRAPGHEQEVRPTVLVGGGWDSTLVENYFGV